MNLEKCTWLNDIFKTINFYNLPHGIIINGPSGVGKHILANKICEYIILNNSQRSSDDHKNLIKTESHPDFYVLDKDKLGVNDISRRKGAKNWDDEKGFRDVISFLNLTPSLAKNKVVLIHNADIMTNEAQNALLKSLEEPASFSYIIMTTNRPRSLNQTIYSRCQLLNIKNLTTNQINDWLSDIGITEYTAIDFPSFATPFNILEDIQNDNHNSYKDFVTFIEAFLFNKSYQTQKLKDINDLNINFIQKINYLIEFLKILLKSRVIGDDLSGSYQIFNKANFNKLKISNIIDELNSLRFDFYSVSSINETYVLNYFFSQLKISIKQ
jgi:hypothetical protein